MKLLAPILLAFSLFSSAAYSSNEAHEWLLNIPWDEPADEQEAYMLALPKMDGLNRFWIAQDDALAQLTRMYREGEVDSVTLNSILTTIYNAPQLETELRKAIEARNFYGVKILIAVTGHNLEQAIAAARRIHNQNIAEMLQAAHDLDDWDENGTSALYRAVISGNVDEVRRLLDAGARVNA